MFLYPTETVYALGVNALDETAVAALQAMKGRPDRKGCSWLVRDIADMKRYAVVSERARQIIAKYLPGPVTVVLPSLDKITHHPNVIDGCLSFRISTDPVAQRVIADFMDEHDAPLTCTSANVSGCPPMDTPANILMQLAAAGRDTSSISVIDDGPRTGQASTVVRIIGEQVEILRQGSIVINLSD